MIRGLYSAAAGLITGLFRQDIIANNLANVNTPGYKKDDASLRSFPAVLIRQMGGRLFPFQPSLIEGVGVMGTGVLVDERLVDLEQGQLQQTKIPLDLAISGQGFFALQSPNGVVYTRDGHFDVDAQGLLVNAEGFPVLGQGGPIHLQGGQVQILEDGTVLEDGIAVDQLRLASFAPEVLVRAGHTNFSLAAGAQEQPVSGRVVQGALEASNVNPTQTMTSMIDVLRLYESSQRVLEIQNETLKRAVNDIGRVGNA